jgi:GNAT superfamily N-acetyltransferase
VAFTIRCAGAADLDAIAAAHRDSIQSIGPAFYPADVVAAWQRPVSADRYRRAMDNGEVFFVAVAAVACHGDIVGFSSDYTIDGAKHGTSVYVRGTAARRGVGSALLREAEAHARAQGATTIEIDASLPGVPFYKRHGYVALDPERSVRIGGREIACVRMRKDLD